MNTTVRSQFHTVIYLTQGEPEISFLNPLVESTTKGWAQALIVGS